VNDPASNADRWFAEHVLPHEPMLRAWLHSRFPNHGEVDDIVQETYSRVLDAYQTGPVRNPKAYVFAIARNLALDHIRRQRAHGDNSLAEIDPGRVLDDGEGIPETLVRNQDLELLTEAIQSLPTRCRQVLTLRKIYGLPQKEIAVQLEISEHTVEAQVAIGMRKCAAFLRQRRDR
jgi:RNA polymerase sigma factor (sigma-70 family)